MKNAKIKIEKIVPDDSGVVFSILHKDYGTEKSFYKTFWAPFTGGLWRGTGYDGKQICGTCDFYIRKKRSAIYKQLKSMFFLMRLYDHNEYSEYGI